jgi:AcrR family transcriptional regulator
MCHPVGTDTGEEGRPAMAERPLRADARRNRDRLLEVAVLAFSTAGPDVALETIARSAGVGIGTLYRHFPTREAMVEAVYRGELDRLCDSVPDLLAAGAPDRALRAWMDRFVSYQATKPGMAEAVRMVINSGGAPFAHSLERLTDALTMLLDAGIRSGALRADVPVMDVLTCLNGVTLAAGGAARREQAGRLLDLMMDGLRPRR